jgi:hypothetical protein
MAWPTDDLTTDHLDQATDDPSQARVELLNAVNKIKAILASLGVADGVCDLDANVKVPLNRLYVGSGQGLDADTVDGKHAAAIISEASSEAQSLKSDIPNGEFEIDSDSDGIPDNWTASTYPGGTVTLDTSGKLSGNNCIKMVHPGGSGNGGGYIDSDYMPVSANTPFFFSWLHYATAAGMKNQVLVRWYDASKVYISSTTVYDSTSNPTSAKHFLGWSGNPPSTAKFFKIRFVGGESSVNVAGTAYFDAVTVRPAVERWAGEVTTQASGSTSSTSWVDVVSVTVDVSDMPNCPITFLGKLEGLNYVALNRFRVGGYYSGQHSGDYVATVMLNFIAGNNNSPTVVYIQSKLSYSTAFTVYFNGKTYVRRSVLFPSNAANRSL